MLTGYGIDDLKTAPLKYWERLGGPAAYCHLEGSQGFVGVLIAEIPAGKSLQPMRHMYEEQVLILAGRGATQFWSEAAKEPITLEWQPGSLFSPPLNVKHQHHNGSATEPVRLATANNLPLVMNIYKSADFVFNVPYEFTDRFAGQKDFFNSEFKPGEEEDRVVNFIPDLNAVTLDPHPERGIGFSRLGIHLSGNSMVGHIMAIESGTYKKAHRHGPGAQVIVIGGKGYSLMWHPGGNGASRLATGKSAGAAGRLVPPPLYHEQRAGSPSCTTPWPAVGRPSVAAEFSEHEGGHLLEHEDEPKEIRALYETELKKAGVPFRMSAL